MQNDVTISLAQTVWILGGISAIWAFFKWALTPMKKIDDHERRINALEDSRAERKQTDQYMMSALNALVNHMIDGNGIDELKKVRNDYQEQIIRHHQ
jgi:hypothetical protein